MSIIIGYGGRHGNTLIQYTFARILSEISGVRMEPSKRGGEFENRSYFPYAIYKEGVRGGAEEVAVVNDQNEDDLLEKCLHLLMGESGNPGIKTLLLNGYFQNYNYYLPYRSQIQNWLQIPSMPDINLKDSVVGIHLRREDYLESGSQLTLSYYDTCIERVNNGREFYLVGKDIEPEIVSYFEKKYRAKHLDNGSIHNFVFLKSCPVVIGSNSSFCFMATFLSKVAHTVFMPLPAKGYWSKSQTQKLTTPLLHIIVEDDNRANIPQPKVIQ